MFQSNTKLKKQIWFERDLFWTYRLRMTQMYDMLNDERAHWMKKTRKIMYNHYDFLKHNIWFLIANLLKNDNFICFDYKKINLSWLLFQLIVEQFEKKRFLAFIISNVIAQLFFKNEQFHCLKKNFNTIFMFNSLQNKLIITVSIMIRHALTKWQHDIKTMIKFDKNVVKNEIFYFDVLFYIEWWIIAYVRLTKTWNNQMQTRRNLILNVMKKKIMHSIDFSDENAVSNANKIVNRYNNFLKNLIDLNDNFFRNIFASTISNQNVNDELCKICANKIIY